MPSGAIASENAAGAEHRKGLPSLRRIFRTLRGWERYWRQREVLPLLAS